MTLYYRKPEFLQLQATAFKGNVELNESINSILGYLLGAARVAGADFAEVFIEKRQHRSYLAEKEKISSVSPSFSSGAGVRIFYKGQDSFVSTSELNTEGITWAFDKALGIFGLNLPSKQSYIPPVHLNFMQDYSLRRNWAGQFVSDKEICEKLLGLNEQTTKLTRHVTSCVANAFEDFQEFIVVNSEGLFCRDKRIHQTFSVQVSSENKGNRTSQSERGGMTNDPTFLTKFNILDSAERVSESNNVMLDADFVESFQGPAVLANRFGGVIFHEACGHLLETTQIERKSTPFANKVGHKIAHTALSAWDEGLTPNAFGSIDIDDEGMPAQSTLLIENGILRNYISDRMGQINTGAPRTGSGRRQNYTFAAASRMRNTYIGAGEYTPEEIISSVEKGIYCKRMGGGSVGATGDFNFGVQEAYLIENGKLTKPVKGATLIGEATHVMNNISMCGNDVELAAGFCGSVSGSIYTTVGQPHIKVDNIAVGGRARGN